MSRSISLILIFLSLMMVSCSSKQSETGKNKLLKITVSIAPQAYIVKRIGGEKVNVNVMVPPAASPETYEPGPKKITELQESAVYFTIGMPFEKTLTGKMKSRHGDTLFIDMGREIVLRNSEKGQTHDGQEVAFDRFDPHVWLDPVNLMKMAENTVAGLIKVDPDNRQQYVTNLVSLKQDLQALHDELIDVFEESRGMFFIVYHPAWGYFADRFGLKQFPVEIEGKEPSVAGMTGLIEFVKKNKAKYIFIQTPAIETSVDSIKTEAGVEFRLIDPLKENIIDNIRESAKLVKEGLIRAEIN